MYTLISRRQVKRVVLSTMVVSLCSWMVHQKPAFCQVTDVQGVAGSQYVAVGPVRDSANRWFVADFRSTSPRMDLFAGTSFLSSVSFAPGPNPLDADYNPKTDEATILSTTVFHVVANMLGTPSLRLSVIIPVQGQAVTVDRLIGTNGRAAIAMGDRVITYRVITYDLANGNQVFTFGPFTGTTSLGSICVNPNTHVAAVANVNFGGDPANNQVIFLDILNNQVLRTISTGNTPPRGVAFNRKTDELSVTVQDSDPVTGTTKARLLHYVNASTNPTLLFNIDPGNFKVTLVNLDTGTIHSTVDLGTTRGEKLAVQKRFGKAVVTLGNDIVKLVTLP